MRITEAIIRDAYSAYDSAERRIMIHKKTVSKNKQSIESIDAGQEFSRTENTRR